MWAPQVRSYVHRVSTDDRTTEPASGQPAAGDARIPQYEIRVSGHLGTRWAAWFDGMTLTDEDDGTTAIRGPVIDQAALHGLLQKLRDLGISLLSLARLAPDTAIEQPALSPNRTRHDPPGARS
jgi:hypothetical protein